MATRTRKHTAHTDTRTRKQTSMRRKVACATACTGLALLTLSLVDCTQAIRHLTGLHWCLAALMAVGIDAGLVACESADMVACDDVRLRRWAYAGMGACMCASVILNCVGVWMNAPTESRILATVFAGMIPCVVFIMGRITGGLMDA